MDTHGIGLLESLWNLVEEIIDTCLRESFHLHDSLHGLSAERGTVSSILELNLAQ